MQDASRCEVFSRLKGWILDPESCIRMVGGWTQILITTMIAAHVTNKKCQYIPTR